MNISIGIEDMLLSLYIIIMLMLQVKKFYGVRILIKIISSHLFLLIIWNYY